MKAPLILTAIALLLSACTTQFLQVPAGDHVFQGATLTTIDNQWNKTPRFAAQPLNKSSQLWTRDGLLLDRLYIIPAIEDGAALFKNASKQETFAPYRANMLPNEIVELTEAAFSKAFAEATKVTATNLRPHKLGNKQAFAFDLELAWTQAPRMNGRALATKHNDQLYLLVYLGTHIHYFNKHLDAALNTIESFRFSDG